MSLHATPDAVDTVNAVVAITNAATQSDLLDEGDALAAGVHATGWIRGVQGGWWLRPAQPSWSLLSSEHPVGFAIFFEDENPAIVFATAQDIARRIDAEVPGVEREAESPDWSTWALDDPRWDEEWDGGGPDWVNWGGGQARVALNVDPERQLGRFRVRPHLHLQIERTDTPHEGLPADDERSRRVTREGTPIARWHLAAQQQLPIDVIDALTLDDDPAIVVAIAREGFRPLRDRS